MTNAEWFTEHSNHSDTENAPQKLDPKKPFDFRIAKRLAI